MAAISLTPAAPIGRRRARFLTVLRLLAGASTTSLLVVLALILSVFALARPVSAAPATGPSLVSSPESAWTAKSARTVWNDPPLDRPVFIHDRSMTREEPASDRSRSKYGFSATRAPAGATACSFSGATLVLMADGSRKPIEDVQVVDKVLATDPETGETVAREVTHLWVHDDTLVDLVVDGDVITTTEDHPFWNETDGEWQRADQLDEGDLVSGADGDLLEVEGLDWSSARTAAAYNLTVDDIHTYLRGRR